MNHLLPIQPPDSSLTAHLAAFDALLSTLQSLPSRTRWPAHIPLNAKARIAGSLVHTNEVRVCLGAGWWVDMTAHEAVAFVQRKKAALLEHHARLQEGRLERGERRQLVQTAPPSAATTVPPISFNPLFMHPFGQPEEVGSELEASRPDLLGTFTVTEPPAPAASTTSTSSPSASNDPAAAIRAAAPSTSEVIAPSRSLPSAHPIESISQASPSSIAQGKPTVDALAELLKQVVANDNLAGAPSDAAPLVNEDGLPIHEIRETPSGELLGATPESLATAGTEAPVEAIAAVEEVEDEGDYWSAEARARRKALFDRVFGGADVDELDSSDDESGGSTSDRSDRDALAARSPPSVNIQQPTPTSPRRSSPPPADLSPFSSGTASPTPDAPHPVSARRSSASQPPPARSILKAQPTRKKSVSFDESVPAPPDSPDKPPSKMGFQLPLEVMGEDEFAPRPVPVINPPKPKEDKGFAGFKKGFLDGGRDKVAKDVVEKAPATASVPSVPPVKKTSLFAQRRAELAPEAESTDAALSSASASASTPAKASGPALPKMSEAKGTSSVKNAVMERPPEPRVSALVKPQITNWTPLSQLPSGGEPSTASSSSTATAVPAEAVPAEEAGNDDDDDDYEFDDLEEDEDEDEYDLDDALLARELALEYHRKRSYREGGFGRGRDAATDDPDAMPLAGGDGDEEGGVMLALPQVDESGRPTIVNPTPDDWRRFVRVGRLENGNLVLAPGQEGWSDGEGDGEGEGEDGGDAEENEGDASAPDGAGASGSSNTSGITSRVVPASDGGLSAAEQKANVERMKRVLMGLEEDVPAPPRQGKKAYSGVSSLPNVLPTVVSRPTPGARLDDGAAARSGTSATTVGATQTARGVGDVVERSAAPLAPAPAPPEAPKRVSRFKAARSGV